MDILFIFFTYGFREKTVIISENILILNENYNEVREVAITNFAIKNSFYLSEILWNIE